MGLIAWLIFGGIVGWIASIIMRRDAQQGILLNIIVGIVGAFIGGILWGLLFGDRVSFDWSIGSFIVAVVGALVLLFLMGLVRRRA